MSSKTPKSIFTLLFVAYVGVVVSDCCFFGGGFSNFHASNEEFRTEFKVPPFQDCVLSFLGFSEEEKINMEERTQKHGTELSRICVYSETTNLKRFMFSNVTQLK